MFSLVFEIVYESWNNSILYNTLFCFFNLMMVARARATIINHNPLIENYVFPWFLFCIIHKRKLNLYSIYIYIYIYIYIFCLFLPVVPNLNFEIITSKLDFRTWNFGFGLPSTGRASSSPSASRTRATTRGFHQSQWIVLRQPQYN